MVESTRKSLAPRILAWIAVVAAVAAPIGYLTAYEEPVTVTTTPVGRGRVEQTLTAISSGTVKAAEEAMIAAGIMGTVVAIPAQEGDGVQADDLLVEIDHSELDAQVALAHANLEAGRARLEQVRIAADIYAEIAGTRVALAEEQLAQARQDYERVAALARERAVSQNEVDKLMLALNVAEKNFSTARANERENLVRQQEILSAESNVRQLEAALAVAEAARKKAFVRAPFSGVVAKVRPHVGEAVTVGMPLVQVVQADDFYVEAPFDEANAGQIKVGQTARINLDAYREMDLAGEVSYISPVVSLNPDLSRTLTVRIGVVEQEERFVAGMSADVTLLVDARESVVYVPSESLVRQRYAYVVEDGRAVRKEVETGIGNWDTREILGGLEEGEELITSVSVKGLEDGVPVRVVDELIH